MYQYAASNNAVFAEPALNVSWEAQLGGRVNGGLSIVGDTLFVESFDKRVYALNVRTGGQLWRTAPLLNVLMNAPLVAGGVVLVGTGGNRWAYDLGDSALMGVRGGDAIYAFNAKTGAQIWSYEVSGEAMPTGAIANVGGRPAFIFAAGDGYLRALDVKDGAVLWRSPYPGFDSMSSLDIVGEYVVGSSNASPNKMARAYASAKWDVIGLESWTWAMHVTDGTLAWTSNYGWGDATPAFGEGYIFVESVFAPPQTEEQRLHGMTVTGDAPLQSKVYALDARTGAKRWEYDDPVAAPYTGGVSLELAIAGVYSDGVLYDSLSFSRHFAAFDAHTGKVLWSIPTTAPVRMSAVVDNGLLYFGDVAGWIYIVRASDGTLQAKVRFPPRAPNLPSYFSTAPPVIVGTTLFIVNYNTIYAIPLSQLKGGLTKALASPARL